MPNEARKALELVPLQDDLNRFRLRAKAPAGEQALVLSVDGRTLGTFKAEELARGVDLALLDNAPWAQAGRALWDAAQYRWKKHFEAWRQMGLQKPATMMPGLATFEPLVRAQRAYADELGPLARASWRGRGRTTSGCARRGRACRSRLGRAVAALPSRELRRAARARDEPGRGRLDARAVRRAGRSTSAPASRARPTSRPTRAWCSRPTAPTQLHLAMGSDDGLAVFLGGRRVFENDVMRGLKPGEDELELPLAAGRNELLFKVTQGGGGFALAVEAQVRGRGQVRQVAP